ncbi:MAG: rhodanese-like domain-containing protein [Thermodesulfovibrionales bacterium]|nr:rhodanese-like domain-containing protein [Thermodesulfovibrionales bacterium]
MGILNYFKPVSVMTAEEVREFLKKRNPGEYNLVDVRQPAEYEKEHIPGSQLIPLGELRERINEIDPSKPTIAY